MGVRNFIESELVRFGQENPATVVYVIPTRNTIPSVFLHFWYKILLSKIMVFSFEVSIQMDGLYPWTLRVSGNFHNKLLNYRSCVSYGIWKASVVCVRKLGIKHLYILILNEVRNLKPTLIFKSRTRMVIGADSSKYCNAEVKPKVFIWVPLRSYWLVVLVGSAI